MALLGDAAVLYARRGWAILPLWWVNDHNHCACPKGVDCKDAGKHPLTDRGLAIFNGVTQATRDLDRLKEIWARFPDANVGGATGGRSGVDVIDVDMGGWDAWQALIEEHGEPVATTPISRTGSGGNHYCFAHRDGVGNKTGNLPAGIDVRGDGGYVVLPPSRTSIGPYVWIREYQTADDLPFWPRWASALADGQESVGNAENPDFVAAPWQMPATIFGGGRNSWLTSLAGTLRRRGSTPVEILATLRVYNEERCDPQLDDDEIRKIANSVGQYAVPTTETFPRTDLGNARRLIDLVNGDLRYCYTWKRWLHWTDKRWKWDDNGEVMRWAIYSAEMMVAEAQAELDADRRNEMIKHGMRSQSLTRLEAAVRLAASDPRALLSHEELDANPWFINVKNGTVDLKTGALLPHDRSHNITAILSHIEYTPHTTTGAPRWQATINEVFLNNPEIVDFFWRWVGYMLTGLTTEDKFVIWHGSGANAKSTIQEILLGVFGVYAGITDPELILERRGDVHPTGLADLFGKRVVFAQETGPGRALNETLVKQLTGGDRIKARRMREDFWEFDPTHKLVLVTNHRPTVRDHGPAFWRRVHVLPFRRIFAEHEQNRNLAAELIATEANEIFAWAVAGCLAWQQRGLTAPGEIKEAVEAYQIEQDIFGSWINSSCELGTDYEEDNTTLFENYRSWLNDGGWRHIPTVQTFSQTLTDRGFSKRKSNGKIMRGGIKLRRAEGPNVRHFQPPSPTTPPPPPTQRDLGIKKEGAAD